MEAYWAKVPRWGITCHARFRYKGYPASRPGLGYVSKCASPGSSRQGSYHRFSVPWSRRFKWAEGSSNFAWGHDFYSESPGFPIFTECPSNDRVTECPLRSSLCSLILLWSLGMGLDETMQSLFISFWKTTIWSLYETKYSLRIPFFLINYIVNITDNMYRIPYLCLNMKYIFLDFNMCFFCRSPTPVKYWAVLKSTQIQVVCESM